MILVGFKGGEGGGRGGGEGGGGGGGGGTGARNLKLVFCSLYFRVIHRFHNKTFSADLHLPYRQ